MSTKKDDILYLNKTALDYQMISNENGKKLCYGKLFFENYRYFYLTRNIAKSMKNYHDNQISFQGQNIENMVLFFFLIFVNCLNSFFTTIGLCIKKSSVCFCSIKVLFSNIRQ